MLSICEGIMSNYFQQAAATCSLNVFNNYIRLVGLSF